MNFLCVDIGGGTQDICYYTEQDTFENSVKMVLPTPSKRIVKQVASTAGDLFIGGGVIGGGEISSVLKDKIAEGHSVFLSKNAYPTVRDDPKYVTNLGAVIVEDVINPNIVFDEFDYCTISQVVKESLGSFAPDVVLAAAQDHGYIAGQKDRVTRFNFLKDFLKNGLRKAFYTSESHIPENFTRWRSLARSIAAKCPNSSLHISDTAVIAAIGAASVTDIRPVITVDAGNCHTFAALIGENDTVYAFFEHHTHSLNKNSVADLIKKLSLCQIDGKEIMENKGHGAYVFEHINASDCPVLVTGPNRQRLFTPSEKVIFSYPKGDTMMAGPIGLLIQAGAKL